MNRTSIKLTLPVLALASLNLVALANTAAYAGAPMLKAPAPGYYRTMIGAFEVTAISDGTVDLPVNQLLTNTTPQAVDAALASNLETSPIETSDNAYLINTGDKLILVDTGAGALFGPTLGKLLSNIEASGYRADQIDDILVTHMHPDHVGGLATGDAAAFPNAKIHVAKADADYWLSEANLDAAPEDQKGFFQGAIASFKPYVEAKQVETFNGPTQFLPGLSAVALPGHTADHTGYLVQSEGQSLLLWGDVVHVAAIQFAHPEITIQFDSDDVEAASERAKLFAEVTDRGYLIGGAHLPFPGLGHVRKQGESYDWVPVNYSAMR